MDQTLNSLDDLLTLSAPIAQGDTEVARLCVRLDQIQAEYETLRASHAETIDAAVAEREDRLVEQEEHMRRLRAMHLQNEMILNSAAEGIFGVDAEGLATFINPAAARMLGWECDQLTGRFLHDLIHSPATDRLSLSWKDCPLFQTLTLGETPTNQYGEFQRRAGTTFPIEFSSVPIREAGQIIGAVVTFRDISERRMLEAQLRQAQKLESIGQLAAGIAHEINTPTQYIGDNLRFLEEAFGDLARVLGVSRRGEDSTTGPEVDVDYLLDEIPRAIRQSLEGLDRVASIVRSMKEFSHPGADRMQSIDLHSAITSTVTVSRNEWKYVADLETAFDASLPPITCLPGDLNQVVLNLIINAAHAIGDKMRGTEQKGMITISTRLDGDWVEIRIGDTGTGIPPSAREKVFDPFFTTKEVGQGTGQGLAIARSVIVEKHGGSLRFETQCGVGTTFFIRIPITPPQRHEAAP